MIEGHYNGPHNRSSPPDLQFNYGGRFWDIGFGVNTVVPGGPLKGLRLSAEWLNPVMTIPTAISSSVRERSGPTRPCRSNPSMNGVRRCEPADAVQFFWTMQAPPSERSSAQSLMASARLSAPIWTIYKIAAPPAQIALRLHEGFTLAEQRLMPRSQPGELGECLRLGERGRDMDAPRAPGPARR